MKLRMLRIRLSAAELRWIAQPVLVELRSVKPLLWPVAASSRKIVPARVGQGEKILPIAQALQKLGEIRALKRCSR
jgi:hypothetical protein